MIPPHVVVYDNASADAPYHIHMDFFDTIKEAVEDQIATGDDQLLEVKTVWGDTVWMRASVICGWHIMSQAAREKELEFDRMFGEEDNAIRQELGIWEE
jgi:FtsP/CotA-like multicopper oxidase with cupredoxin domain